MGGEWNVHIPGRAIPVHVTILEGTPISRNEVCDSGQFPTAGFEWWNAL